MARRSQLALPAQKALGVSGIALAASVYFLAVCLCSAGTIRSVAILLVLLTLSAAFLFYERLRDRLTFPILALAAVVVMDGISCFYAVSGKLALFEFLKVFSAFCMAIVLLAFIEKDRPGRKLCIILEGCCSVAGLTSIDLLSTRWISGAVLEVLGWFTQDYTDLEAVEDGVRIISIFMSPNVFAGCMGIGVLLGLGLAITAEESGERSAHLVCLSVNSLAFVLAFSMGACVMIVPAFLVFLILTGTDRRLNIFVLMVEALIVTMICAFPISVTSMTAWDGVRPIPLLCTIGGAAVLCALDRSAGQRLAAKLAGYGKAVFVISGIFLAVLIMFIAAACSLTTSSTLQTGGFLRRSIYPAPGSYVLEMDGSGDPTVIIESQDQEDTMMHTSSELYRGPLSQVVFTVPEGSLVVWFTFYADVETRLDAIKYVGEQDSGKVPLDYLLLPGFIANRLQGLWANQNAIQRFVFFEDGLKLFRRSPVIGLGLGAFENGVRSVQTFRYDTKYAHDHYIQTLAETGCIGLALFLVLLGVSGACVLRGREKPLAPALGAALIFMAGHALVEFTFSIYCYLPMAFTVFAAIGLCCGDDIPLPAWMEKKTVKNGLALGVCALVALFGVLLGCNIAARNLVTDSSNLEQLERAAALDPFEKADYLLTYVIQAGGSETSQEVREKADGYAARLAQLDSNSIPIYLAEYYLQTGRTEQGLEQAERYVDYVSADASAWQKTFDLLEKYEQDTEEYRTGVVHIADLLDTWNGENLGHIELNEQAQAFIARMRS